MIQEISNCQEKLKRLQQTTFNIQSFNSILLNRISFQKQIQKIWKNAMNHFKLKKYIINEYKVSILLEKSEDKDTFQTKRLLDETSQQVTDRDKKNTQVDNPSNGQVIPQGTDRDKKNTQVDNPSNVQAKTLIGGGGYVAKFQGGAPYIIIPQNQNIPKLCIKLSSPVNTYKVLNIMI